MRRRLHLIEQQPTIAELAGGFPAGDVRQEARWVGCVAVCRYANAPAAPKDLLFVPCTCRHIGQDSV